MDITILVKNIRVACEIKIDVSNLIDALIKYIDYIESANMIQYGNDKLLLAKDILLQDEKDEYLKLTRVMVHLEDARIILCSQRDKIFLRSKKDRIQHKIDQICYELAMLHKWFGNHPDTIKKYAIDLSSLKNPTKDYLGYGKITEKAEQYFIMSKDDLKFLLTEEQYKDYIEFYCKVVPEARKAKQEEEFLKCLYKDFII